MLRDLETDSEYVVVPLCVSEAVSVSASVCDRDAVLDLVCVSVRDSESVMEDVPVRIGVGVGGTVFESVMGRVSDGETDDDAVLVVVADAERDDEPDCDVDQLNERERVYVRVSLAVMIRLFVLLSDDDVVRVIERDSVVDVVGFSVDVRVSLKDLERVPCVNVVVSDVDRLRESVIELLTEWLVVSVTGKECVAERVMDWEADSDGDVDLDCVRVPVSDTDVVIVGSSDVVVV